MKKILCPSIFNLAFDNLSEEIKRLDEAGCDIIHFDAMDGYYVPNIGLSLQDLDVVRRATRKLIDVHMMIIDPGRYVQLFAEHGADIIYIHPDADMHPAKTIARIVECGKLPGIAINPETSVCSVEELLPLVKYVLVMAVHPGLAGQRYLDYVEPKISRIVKTREKYGFHIVIDGGVNEEVCSRLSKIGVEGCVLGNLILFNREEKDYSKTIDHIRKL